MIKIVRFSASIFPRNSLYLSKYNGVCGTSPYCTSPVAVAARAPAVQELFKRISPHGDPQFSIVPILDKWVLEGLPVGKYQLNIILKLLRKFKRFTHALQLSEWMDNNRYFELSPGDIAIRLDLISKVHGLEVAEKYFSSFPDEMRTFEVYGALLSCYCEKKLLDKAEIVMQKLRDLDYRFSLSYNVMLSLYAKLGKLDKLHKLYQEMEEKGIFGGRDTFYILLNAYVAKGSIELIEMLMYKMRSDPSLTVDWRLYSTAANGYLRAGQVDRSLELLKEAEKLIRGKSSKYAYRVLLTLYARLAQKDEVYRIWGLISKSGRVRSEDYSFMMSSLVKLDDIVGAEKIWEEW